MSWTPDDTLSLTVDNFFDAVSNFVGRDIHLQPIYNTSEGDKLRTEFRNIYFVGVYAKKWLNDVKSKKDAKKSLLDSLNRAAQTKDTMIETNLRRLRVLLERSEKYSCDDEKQVAALELAGIRFEELMASSNNRFKLDDSGSGTELESDVSFCSESKYAEEIETSVLTKMCIDDIPSIVNQVKKSTRELKEKRKMLKTLQRDELRLKQLLETTAKESENRVLNSVIEDIFNSEEWKKISE